MSKVVCIVSGGSVEDRFIRDYMCNRKYDLMIACDRGMHFFWRSQMEPDVVLGDFDSTEDAVLADMKQLKNTRMIQYPAEKDWTDTELALRYAIEQGATQIDLFGATGSRLDHVMGNIHLLGLGIAYGVEIHMLDAHNRIRLVNRNVTIRKEQQFGNFVSLIPFTGEVQGLTLQGMKYPLTDADMKSVGSLGISNEITDTEATISFDAGLLLVIESKD